MPTHTRAGQPFDRLAFDAVVRRRLFFTEAFEIYRSASGFVGDNRGLFDYGPPGCSLQANIVDLWRKHFVLEEDMLETGCVEIPSRDYLRADHLVEAVLESRLWNDEEARAQTKVDAPILSSRLLNDHTVQEYKQVLAQIDNYDGPELGELIKRFDIRNPDGNNEVEPPKQFNLMFKSSIGPSAAAPVYLRPETAQGQFLNFRKLLEHNNNSMPFASASIGKSYRNEISPRSGILRVREFLMAEIEHYIDPQGGKRHSRFSEVASITLPVLDRDTQLAGNDHIQFMSVADAVSRKVIDNQTLGYFLARIYAFLLKIGVDESKLRFRQHMPNEMAHYACDCWDAELLTSYGWIECVGCADRSAYDLTVHTNRTKSKLVVREKLSEPRNTVEWQVLFDKKVLGKTYRATAKLIEDAMTSKSQNILAGYATDLEENGEITIHLVGHDPVKLGKEVLSIDKISRIEHVREYVPNVIEPSFGIGRIMYSLLEHVYWHRANDVARAVLSLPLTVAPTKVLVVPLSSQVALTSICRSVSQRLRKLGISNRIDDSGASIGKRYARNDELGTPLGVTIDFDTLKDQSVTLRDRDSAQQVRASQDTIIEAIRSLTNGEETWDDVYARLPHFQGGE